MKIYNDPTKLDMDYPRITRDETLCIAKICPFHVRMSSRSFCGNWCPHFFIEEKEMNGKKSKEIYITCSGVEVCIGVEE